MLIFLGGGSGDDDERIEGAVCWESSWALLYVVWTFDRVRRRQKFF